MVSYGMVCYGDRGWGEGFRCEDDVSGQLVASVGERWQVTPLRTVPLPSLLPSTPGCT